MRTFSYFLGFFGWGGDVSGEGVLEVFARHPYFAASGGFGCPRGVRKVSARHHYFAVSETIGHLQRGIAESGCIPCPPTVFRATKGLQIGGAFSSVW